MNKLRASFFIALCLGGLLVAAEYYYGMDLGLGLLPQTPAPQTAVAEAEEEFEEEGDLDEDLAHAPMPAAETAALPSEPGAKARQRRTSPTLKPSEVQLTIRDIQFSGVTAVPVEKLKEVVKDFIGLELSVQEALDIPAKVSNYYSSQNLVARAMLVGSLDRQGVLKVSVIETQITQTQLDKTLSTIAPVPVETKPEAAAVINLAKIEAKEPPPAIEKPPVPVVLPEPQPAPTPAPTPVTTVAEVKAVAPPPPPPVVEPVKKAEKKPEPSKDDETEFILKNYGNKSRQYELLADNYGYEATGSNRLGAGVTWSDALSEGDKLSLMGLKSRGSDYARMGYRFNTGIEGLSLGLNLSKLKYEVVNGVQSAINLSGDAVKKGVELVYTLVNEPDQVSSVALNFNTRNVNNTAANPAESSSYTTRVPSLEFKGLIREMVPGGAVLSYDAVFSHGTVDMNGSPNQQADIDGARTAGSFSKFRFDGSILQPITGLTSLYAKLGLQRANKNLESYEKFYLGGPLGVRAYGWGEGVGSDGELLSLELRERLDRQTVLAGFYDWGQVRVMHDASFTGAPTVNSIMLKGYGLSLSHELANNVTVKGTWARRQGSNPDPLSAPQGPEGEYDRNRFWLTMETRF